MLRLDMELHLSIVIPAYNEETRIGASLDAILDFLSSQPYPTEVIVVNDGSTDLTAEVVRYTNKTLKPSESISGY